LLDSVKVNAYGSITPLKQLASVAAPEPQQLVIRPFDTTIIKDIEKGIVASELGLNPQSDGRIIRINIPPLSTDTRKKLVARIKELSEEAKISIRNVRRDANKAIETAEKDKTISEDQRDTSKEQVQELTKKFEEDVTELAKSRESDVMDQ
jgi:ribosome recycling factor